jgi:hypothetical protein
MLDGLICPCAAIASAITSRRLLVNSVSQGLSGSEITYEVIRTYVRLSGDLTQAAGRTHPKSKTRARARSQVQEIGTRLEQTGPSRRVS